MNIIFENPDKVNGLMTVTVEQGDYQADVDKALKDYRKKANVPGFRPGQVPMGLIKRQVGTSVKVDVVNRLLGEKMYEYIRENKIQMLGEPMPNEKQVPQDFKTDGPFEFIFDIAVAPELDATLTDKDTVDYYNIDVDDKLIDQQVEMFQSRAGHYDKVEEYDPAQNDMLKGDLRELDADGNAKEDGVVVESAVMMPEYIKVDEQKALFDGAKLGSVITFNPRKAYPENDAELTSLLKIDKEAAKDMTSDFTYLVTEVSRFVKGEVNQELFDQVFGKDEVKDKETFRKKIAEGIKSQLANDSDYKFLTDLRKYLENRVGELQFPDTLLKRLMMNNNKDKGQEFVESNYEASVKELKWHLIKEQLVAANGIKVEDKDIKDVAVQVARMQFAQYGMSNVPDEYLENYADSILKDNKNIEGFVDRAIDIKLIAATKNVVKLNEKNISLDDFNKMMQEK
ncbi:trigger factor [Xylanibacter muris]|uniref:Trigger factor n=1 Tax=Xylanibacter muris TaxID=2736290 RepID=A0ABX2AST0_9BACT|nr:trigger factor [Xylanibacter muris]NPD93082.1 trigger factor [Xylanibacter muris]